MDKLGPRLSLGLFVAWWSVANCLTGWARSLASLGGFRFLLGLGEAGNWTASPKAVAEWFPAKERGFAIGLYTAGTPMGMTLAPIFIIWLAGAFGWRSVFVVTGLLGLGLARALAGFVSPGQEPTPGSPKQERQWILSDEDTEPPMPQPPENDGPGCRRFGRLEVWCLLIGRMFSDPVWFFYQNWYPKYLVSARGFTQEDVSITWVMFLAAGLGSLFGGWISGRFIKRALPGTGAPVHDAGLRAVHAALTLGRIGPERLFVAGLCLHPHFCPPRLAGEYRRAGSGCRAQAFAGRGFRDHRRGQFPGRHRHERSRCQTRDALLLHELVCHCAPFLHLAVDPAC